ncbi:uncharacterized protein LOC117919339 [Vitis riparia]|uniref:uncharacterized protein LOC117919339 n=1 Tax=Vitis riparia TaxID=96939 RepID=UPI00155A91A6|nr:uncharacterized protein LOC117919339 [Vitis riparia]
MSKKRDSASFLDEETKKMKLDIYSSSGLASDVKQEEDGSEGVIDPPASAVVDNQGSLSPLMENKPRNQDDKDFSSGSVPASTHDHDSETKKTGSSSSSLTESASCSSINKRTLVYKKSLTRDDVFYRRLMIPLELGKEFLPEPEKYKGRYDMTEISVMDHKRRIWDMEAAFDELSSSYMFFLNWDKYVKRYGLEPEDVIFLYEDPTIDDYFLIEYEKRKRDSNPKETT